MKLEIFLETFDIKHLVPMFNSSAVANYLGFAKEETIHSLLENVWENESFLLKFLDDANSFVSNFIFDLRRKNFGFRFKNNELYLFCDCSFVHKEKNFEFNFSFSTRIKDGQDGEIIFEFPRSFDEENYVKNIITFRAHPMSLLKEHHPDCLLAIEDFFVDYFNSDVQSFQYVSSVTGEAIDFVNFHLNHRKDYMFRASIIKGEIRGVGSHQIPMNYMNLFDFDRLHHFIFHESPYRMNSLFEDK